MANEINNPVIVNNSSNNGEAKASSKAVNQPKIKTFTLTVKRVQVMDTDNDFVSVNLQFDKAIPGFIRAEDGSYNEANVDHISFSRSAITRQLCALNDLIATYRDACEGAFNRKQLSIILHGAKLTIKRTLHVAGEVIEGREDALERDQWFSEIVGVAVSKTAAALLLNALTLS